MTPTDLEIAAEAALAANANPSTPDPNAQPRRRGRPPGSKNRPKPPGYSALNPAPSPPGAGAEEPDDKPFVYVADESSIIASTILGQTAWGIASAMLPIRPLTDAEAERLGKALDPVLAKWMPIIGEWKYEVGLLMTILALAKETAIKKPVTDAETVGDATPGA